MWTTLDALARFNGGKTPSMDDKTNWENGKHLWITSKDMKSEVICNSQILLSDSGLQGMTIHQPGTILMVNRSGILRRTLPLGILQKEATINQDLKAITPFLFELTPFLFICLKAFEPIILQNYKKAGTTVDNINFDHFVSIPIPLPPVQEQGRIVQSIKNWENRIDDIEESGIQIQKTIETTKSKILELAIHGKLVAQDSSEESAIELLKRINPAFQPSDNLHYDAKLPDGWCVARLEEVAEYGDTSNVDVTTITSSSWVLELEDIEKDTASILEKKKKSDREINGVRHSFRKGQILYSKLRTYLNKVLIATEDGFCSTEIVPITASKALLSEYLLIVLRSPYFLEYTASCGYGVKMPRLGTNDAKKAIIPIPPHAEQVRIVKKVSDLMTVISSL